MNYKYYLVDVFSRSRFGGNQLAVLPDVGGNARHIARGRIDVTLRA